MSPSALKSVPSRRLRALPGLLLAGALAFSACSEEDSPSSPGNPNALITLSSPKAGQTFKVGDTVWFEWKAKVVPEPVDAVDPMITLDTGKTWVNLRSGSIAAGTPSWGRWGWKVPDSLRDGTVRIPLAGKSAKVKVEQYSTSDPNMVAESGIITFTAP